MVLTKTDTETFQEWKSETLKALSSLPAYKKHIERHSHDVAEILAEHLRSVFLGIEGVDSLRSSLLEDLVRPAMDLNHTMRLSKTTYELRELECPPGVFAHKEIRHLPAEDFRFFNLESRKAIEDPKGIRADRNGIKVTACAYLEPGMFKGGNTKGQGKWLMKPSVVLHLACPLTKKTKLAGEGTR